MAKKQQELTAYEMALLAKPLLPEDIKTKIIDKVEALVKELGGSLVKKHDEMWGKRHLAYPIHRHEEGYYAFFTLELDGEKLDELNKEIRLITDILRTLVVKEDQL